MKSPRIHSLGRKALFLFITYVSLAGTTVVFAQTTFSLSSTAPNFTTGAAAYDGGTGLGGIVSSGSTFSSTGTALNNIIPLTFGQSFTVSVNGTSTPGGTAAWLYDGLLGGSSIATSTVLPISYNFSLAKNAGITSDVTWNLYFDGDRHGASADTLIASGTLSAASGTFSDLVSYSYTSAAVAGNNFRAYLEVAFTSNNPALGQGIVTATMSDTGFGGGGITIGASAVPEPSTYAMFAGLGVLGFAAWRRRGAKLALAG